MTLTNAFRITVYDKNLNRKAIVSTPIELRTIPRHNLKGTATFSLALDHPALADLMQSGSRAVIHYRGKQVLSGPITERSINGPSISGSATFQVEDDFRMLHSLLGWPVPNSPITNQLGAEYFVITGPAETVVKQLVKKNAIDRLGMNVTIAPDLGRGDVITVEVRMEPLFDKLFPAVETAGLGVSVKQGASSLVVDVYEASVYAPILSEESGIVQDWSWTNSAPKATNIIMGGRGEKASREFRSFNDAAATSEWGLVLERFEDATDIGSRLNDWYSRFDNAVEDLARKSAEYSTAASELNMVSGTQATSSNALAAINATYPAGSDERAQALSDYNEAIATKNSSASQAGSALADMNAAQTTLTGIQAEYSAIRTEYEAQIAKQGADHLVEQGESTGIRMVLSETDGFRYGDSVTVGDRVSMKVGPGLVLTDVLREAELTWSFNDGVTATPSVGDITDNPDRAFAKALRNSVTRIRKIEVK